MVSELIRVLKKIIISVWFIGLQSLKGITSRRQLRIIICIDRQVTIRTVCETFNFFRLSHLPIALLARPTRHLLALGPELRWHSDVGLVWHLPRSAGELVYVSDTIQDDQNTENRFSKTINLCYDYSPKVTATARDVPCPYMMHPQMYVQYNALKDLPSYRTKRRRLRMLFGGNVGEGYDKPHLREIFHVMTRFEILSTVERTNLARIVASPAELDALLESDYTNEFILIRPEVRIDEGKWLWLVSQADFFLCPPGVDHPLSHNSVESMAVGTIPVINHPDWFVPTLTHLRDCIVFRTKEDLQSCISMVRNMDESEIHALRKGVLEYYSEHLEPERAVRELLSRPLNHVNLHVLDELQTRKRHRVPPNDARSRHR